MLQTNRLSRLGAPLSVNLEVTTACNLSCSFCFNAAPEYEEMVQVSTDKHQDGARKKILIQQGKQISLQQLRKERIFQVLDKLSSAGVFEIRLFGGEFTVFKPWKEVIQYALEKGFFISFVSNGYLLDTDDVDLLVRCGVRDCTISIHGPEDVHDKVTRKPGSFQRAMNAVGLLRKRGVLVSIAYTPNKENLQCVYDFVHLMKSKYGVEHFSISRLFSDKRYEHLELTDYHYLLSEIDRCHLSLGVTISLADSFPRCQVPMKYWSYLSYCSQGVGFAQVDFNGNLKHCSATSKPLGNLLEVSMKELWEEKLEGMRNLDHLPKSCKICPIFCGGGCTVSRGVENKFAPDEFIPWPKDESWLGAIWKAAYNRMRKIAFSVLRWKKQQISPSKVISPFPKLTQRYQTRIEPDGVCIAMFERSGTKVLSPLALFVLPLLDGDHTIDSIFESCHRSFPDCAKSEVETIVRSVL
jgi:radical SAM protein with 4Fe4S-binding SPASM domain